jgi:hypothetical protein
MTSEQLNQILNTKSYDYKFINRNSKDSVIISINGLGVNHLSKNIINKEEFKEQGNSIFDILDHTNLLQDPSLPDRKYIFDFYNTFNTHPSCINSDILFLADGKSNHYLTGIRGIASNIEEIKDFILSFILTKGYKTVYFVGTCSGAWMVALQSLSLQITNNQLVYIKALLFNPLNTLSDSNHFKLKTNSLLDENSLDMIKINEYANNVLTNISIVDTLVHFVIYYNKNNMKNTDQAGLYAQMNNDKLKIDLKEIDTNDISLTAFLRRNKQLTPILTDFFNN